MKCNEAQNHMMKFFDKEINDIEEAQLKQHLKSCKTCCAEFSNLERIFAEIEQEDLVIEPPEDFEIQVMNRIENETKMYKKNTDDNAYVYNILLGVVSFIFVIVVGGLIWESFSRPIDLFAQAHLLLALLKQFSSAAMSMCKGMLIAVVGVTSSLYKTYYYAYIVLGILLLVLQKIFITMVKESNGGAQ